MTDRGSARHFDLSDDGLRLTLAGAWRLAELPALAPELAGARPRAPLTVDGEKLASLDSAAALQLVRSLAAAGVDPAAIRWQGFSAPHRRVLDGVLRRGTALAEAVPTARRGWLASIGVHATIILREGVEHLNFMGEMLAAFVEVARSPRRLRLRELTTQLEQACLNAIPVVILVTLLIGVVFAYLLGLQAEQYGANIFVVDGVGIGMSREFAPIIVAIIVAGRSGAAFTAQLGSMRLTEETDAIRTLGLSPMQVLVVPRVLALLIALPLLSFIGLVAGLVGAGLVADAMLGIPPVAFADRLHFALDISHVWAGLVKTPVFALAVAVIGCRMGMHVGRDTRAVGLATTSTVVQGIVNVILLDAAFAVLFQELGI
ncbi:MAG: ABC transporter permease [Burkholderiales bacterium]|jgi:phospholipid/cholesterol/gamma-HCH transport system permease protein|nr:ABC transporter permease [Burkholderiales bacterium]